jgi:hypothetical protein
MDLPLPFAWEIVALAALAVTVTQLLVPRSRRVAAAVIGRLTVAIVTVAAVLAAVNFAEEWQSANERRALQARASELASRALAPGSALACLGSQAGEAVETACEKSVFATPESAAAALAFTEARMALLADAQAIAGDDPTFAALIAGLRRAVELDRFGLAAQVLATRDRCSAEDCPALALVSETTALRANLKARAYDTYVARYAAGWEKREAAPAVAEAKPADEPSQAPPAAPLSSRYDFPSAASIPPVSIMTAEPPRPAAADGAPARAADAPGAPQRLPPPRPQTQGAATR